MRALLLILGLLLAPIAVSQDLLPAVQKVQYTRIDPVHGEVTGTGTAFYVNGYWMTVAHCVLDDAGKPFADIRIGDTKAKVLSFDKDKDLALLDCKLTPTPLIWASSVSRNDPVTLQGYPRGKPYLSTGKILSIYRNNTNRGEVRLTYFNHGFSGAPLLNNNGEVVGVAVEGLPADKIGEVIRDRGLIIFREVVLEWVDDVRQK